MGDSLALAAEVTSTLLTGFVIAMIADWKLCLIIICVIPLVGLQGYAQIRFLKGFSEDAKVVIIESGCFLRIYFWKQLLNDTYAFIF